MGLPLKFRAWLIEHECMCRVDQLWLEPSAHKWGAGILDEHNDFHQIDKIRIMQYTGFNDKNDSEIYEDDFVGEKDDIIQIGYRFGEVKLYAWGLDLYDAYGDRMKLGPWNDLEIIGNSHANHELLKE